MKKGTCTYCGLHREITDDHIPPKNLFPKPLPQNLITVPSCMICNEGTSKDDEYFRLILSLRDETFDHPSVQNNWPKIKRSLECKSHGGLRRILIDSTQFVNLRSNAGLYLGKAGVIEPDSKRMDKVLRRIAKGLFYSETGYRLPDNYDIVWHDITNVRDLKQEEKDTIIQMLNYLEATPMKNFGNNVFKYRYMYTNDDPNCFWGTFSFYLRIWFLVYSMDSNLIPFVLKN